MSLLAEIQNECLAKDGSVSRLLRLCLQLAARLKHEPLKTWVLHELNGYPDAESIPDYRFHHTRSLGFFADQFRQVTLQIPGNLMPEPLKTRFNTARMDQPISQYEELLQGSSTDAFQMPWPQELALRYGPKVSPIQCLKMWQELPRSAVAGLVDTVKTRVLSMVLDIEMENPAAGEIAGSAQPISESKVAQIFNTNIYGGQVGNVAAGSSGVTQQVGDQVVAGDLASLKKYLGSIGVTDPENVALVAALKEDQVSGAGLGARVNEWLANLRQRVNVVGADIAKQSLAGMAAQAVLVYLGIGS